MNKMQNIKNKIQILITLLVLLVVQDSKAQDNSGILAKADSLFGERRYTQSLELYHQLFQQEEVYTPQMLLKMAYINEGLGDYSKALYYLNVYYTKTSDRVVLEKMEQLAEKYKLAGYNFTDTDLFLDYYNKYISEITFGALAVCLLLFAFLFYQKRKGQSVLLPATGLVLALILVAFMVNTEGRNKLAIIKDGPSYLMKGPSSGAGVIDIVKAGHRVSIEGQQDIWTKIIWNGAPAYIRKSQLMVIN